MSLNPYESVEKIARRSMTIFFVIDVSGSMAGKKIGAVNQAIEEVLPEIQKLSDENADAEIKIAVMTFSNGFEWLYKPMPVADFKWDFIDADGCTDLGEACKELAKKLSRKEFLDDANGSYAPVIYFMSDGEPTDDYKSGLKVLKENKWFQTAIKVAIAIGDDANQNVLEEITGNKELVVTVHTPEKLKKWIRFVSVASKMGSQSSTVKSDDSAPATKEEQFIELLKEEKETDTATNPDAEYDDWD